MRYELISGILFTIIALGQITRAILGWPVQIASVSVPIWVSVIAFLITGSLAIWGFRLAGRRTAVA
jgi:hypothetical protein